MYDVQNVSDIQCVVSAIMREWLQILLEPFCLFIFNAFLCDKRSPMITAFKGIHIISIHMQ